MQMKNGKKRERVKFITCIYIIPDCVTLSGWIKDARLSLSEINHSHALTRCYCALTKGVRQLRVNLHQGKFYNINLYLDSVEAARPSYKRGSLTPPPPLTALNLVPRHVQICW